MPPFTYSTAYLYRSWLSMDDTAPSSLSLDRIADCMEQLVLHYEALLQLCATQQQRIAQLQQANIDLQSSLDTAHIRMDALREELTQAIPAYNTAEGPVAAVPPPKPATTVHIPSHPATPAPFQSWTLQLPGITDIKDSYTS